MDNIQFQSRLYSTNEAPYAGKKIARIFTFIVGRYLRGRILDAGAGDGSRVKHLSERYDIVGVDIEPRAGNVMKAELSNLPFKSATFGTAVMTEVLEHLLPEQQKSALSELHRVLDERGVLITTVPYKEPIERNIVECPHCGESFHRYGHWQTFDKSAMRTLMEDNGYDVVWSKTYSVGAMAAFGLGKYFNFLYRRFTQFDAFSETLFTVARKRPSA
jgi:SAM-dependent methyltransferase